MKTLHWGKIPDAKIKGTIWSLTLTLTLTLTRYTTGEAMARRVEHVNVTLRSGSLYLV